MAAVVDLIVVAVVVDLIVVAMVVETAGMVTIAHYFLDFLVLAETRFVERGYVLPRTWRN